MAAGFDFKGRRIAVTGAAMGLGRATAELIAELGGEVIALDVVPVSIPRGRFVQVDLADPASIGLPLGALRDTGWFGRAAEPAQVVVEFADDLLQTWTTCRPSARCSRFAQKSPDGSRAERRRRQRAAVS